MCIRDSIRTSKLLAIEIAYEILGSAATKPAAWIDIHRHYQMCIRDRDEAKGIKNQIMTGSYLRPFTVEFTASLKF